jgi:CelD/BcsL family acetyltransferase involved in cellulose biosynthesis
VIERHTALRDVEAEWDALADRVGASPWLRPGFIKAWLDAFSVGELEVVAVRRGSQLSAVIPMLRRRGALIAPTNWHTPQFAPLAEDTAGRAELAEALVAERPRRLAVSFAPPETVNELRESASAACYRVVERIVQSSPFLDVAGDWGAYLRSRGRELRKSVERRRRRLQEGGSLALHVDDGGRLEELLGEGFRVEALGWKGRRGTAILARPETRRFYEDVARWSAARGTLRLAFLRLDGRAFAFQLMLEEGGVAYLVKSGYDEEYRQFGPGQLMAAELMQRAFEIGLRRVEFLGAANPYKLEWASGVDDLVRLEAFAPSSAGLAEFTARTHGRRIAKRVLASVARLRVAWDGEAIRVVLLFQGLFEVLPDG